jgi:hypothetical protein
MLRLIQKDSGEGIVCAIGKDRVHIAPITPSGSRPVSASHGSATASAPPSKSCGSTGCGGHKGRGSCGGCAALVSVDNGYIGKFHIPIKNPENFKPGDRVRYSRFIPEPGLASALVFGVPVVFALSAIVYHIVNAPQSTQSPESPATVFSVIMAFFGGFAVLGVIDYFFKRRYPASIIDGGAGGGNGS